MSDNVSSTTPVYTPLPLVLYILAIVEVVPLVLLALAAVLNFLLIFRCALLHRNLKAILLAQSAVIIVYVLARFTQMATKNNSPNSWLGQLMIACITFGNFIGHVLIIERTMATIFARSYDLREGWLFTIGWISIIGTFLILDPLFARYSTLSVNHFVVQSVLMHLALLLSIVEIVIFFILVWYNRSHYNNRGFTRSTYSLTERYQFFENIQIGKQLASSFLLHLVNIIASNLVAMSAAYGLVNLLGGTPTLARTALTVHAFTKLSIEATVITFHPKLKKDLWALLRRVLELILCRKLTHRSKVSDIGMANRANNRDTETEEHFRMLAEHWK